MPQVEEPIKYGGGHVVYPGGIRSCWRCIHWETGKTTHFCKPCRAFIEHNFTMVEPIRPTLFQKLFKILKKIGVLKMAAERKYVAIVNTL